MGKRSLCIAVIFLVVVGSIAVPSANSFETTDTNGFPYPGDDWAWEMIGTPYAHQLGEYGDDVLVAVMDTGIDYNHPDLKDRMWDGIGYDFVNDNDHPMDNDGHGTHVAGIAASVAPNARLMALKVMEEEGGRWVEVAQAIMFARENDADIITMSFGGEQSPMSMVIQIQMDFAYQQGVLMVAAAGNDNTDKEQYPAANDNVIAVSALNNNRDKTSYSNYGDWIELSAPGGDSAARVFSTVPGESYGYKSGTSMACPFVTGAAAIMIGANPGMTNVQVRDALREQALDLGEPGRDPIYGYGMVNAYRAAGGRVPTPPREPVAKGDNATVDLSWSISWGEGLSAVEGYRIYRGPTHGDINFLVEIDGLTYTDTDVVNDRPYHYYITAINSEGESPASETVGATPRESPITPSVPRDVSTTMVQGGVRVSWKRPLDDGGDDILEYYIYRDDEHIASVDMLEHIDTDIYGGTSYDYRVSALNSIGEGTLSESSRITVPGDTHPPPDDNGEDLSPLPIDENLLLMLMIIIVTVILVVGLAYHLRKKK